MDETILWWLYKYNQANLILWINCISSSWKRIIWLLLVFYDRISIQKVEIVELLINMKVNHQAFIVLLNIWFIFLLLLLVPNSSASFFLYWILQPCCVVSPVASCSFNTAFTSIRHTFLHSTMLPVDGSTTAARYLLFSPDTYYATWSS